MALFGKKNKDDKKTEALSEVSTFVMEPHIAEKSTGLAEKGVYVFKTDKRINKAMVRQAIKEKYNVVPRKINIVNLPNKPVTFRGRKSEKRGFKKAMVYLKAGDKIELS